METEEEIKKRELIKNQLFQQPSIQKFEGGTEVPLVQPELEQTSQYIKPVRNDFPLGEILTRGAGLLGDVIKGDTSNKTQAEITKSMDIARKMQMERDYNLPDSDVSNRYRAIASKLFPQQDFSKWAAADYEKFAPVVERIYMEKSARQIIPGTEKKEKELPPQLLSDVIETKNTYNMFDKFKQYLNLGGKEVSDPLFGKLKEMNKYDAPAQEFLAKAKLVAQVIGRQLEGGKLTDEDIKRYEKMLPTIGDTKETIQAKLNNVNNMLNQNITNKYEGLKSVGYNMSGFDWMKNSQQQLQKPIEKQQTQKQTTVQPTAQQKNVKMSVKDEKTGITYIKYVPEKDVEKFKSKLGAVIVR